MPLYDFHCASCAKTFEERAPVGAKVTTCSCGSIAHKRFVPTTQIRISEGFRQVTRSDVCPEKGKDWIPSVWPSAGGRRKAEGGSGGQGV